MANKRVTPPLGAYGKYELIAPWPTANNISYRCVSLRRVEEFVKSGQDLFALVYQPMGLTAEIYQLDVSMGVVIVGLLGSNGERIFVPDTYIKSYPDQNSVSLNYIVLSVDLGPQPDNIPLDAVMDEIKIVASKFSGIEVSEIQVNAHQALSTSVLTQEQYINAADAREKAVELNETTADEVIRLREINRQQDELIQQLLAQQTPSTP